MAGVRNTRRPEAGGEWVRRGVAGQVREASRA